MATRVDGEAVELQGFLGDKDGGTDAESFAKPADIKSPSSPRRTRISLFVTAALYASTIVSGLCCGIIGPTLPQLELYFNTSTSSLAWSLTSYNLGYLVGAALCGVVFERVVRKDMYEFLGHGAFATAFALTVLPGNLLAYIIILGTFGMFQALAMTGVQPYLLEIWDGHKWKNSLFQALILFWSVGNTLGPFLTQPFLLPLAEEQEGCLSRVHNHSTTDNTTSELRQVVPSRAYLGSSTQSGFPSLGQDVDPDYGQIRFAYVAGGLVAVVPVLMFAAAHCMRGKTQRSITKSHDKDGGEKKDGVPLAKHHLILAHILVFLFSFFYQLVEFTSLSMIAMFAVQHLCWENHQAALLSSLLYATYGLGCLIGILLAAHYSPRQMLAADFLLQVAGFTMMLFVTWHDVIMWVSTAVVGAAMSTVYASCFLRVSDTLGHATWVSANTMVGASLSGMFGPLVVGYMFELWSPSWYVYMCVTGTVIQILVYAALELVLIRIEKSTIRR